MTTLEERLNAGLCAAQNQGVHIVGTFIGIHGLQVHHVADHAVLVGDAIATEMRALNNAKIGP